MRVRGLKQYEAVREQVIVQVAPHAGAWIETKGDMSFESDIESHPMRVRGLKLYSRTLFA